MDIEWVKDDYIEVLKQIINIATPSKHFNNHAPCPWLAIGISTGKVAIERGRIPTNDGDSAKKFNNTRWATAYWYQPIMKAAELDLTCRAMSNSEITCLYMHKDDATDPMGQKLTGKYPLLIVQNTKLLESARRQMPPDYPYSFD